MKRLSITLLSAVFAVALGCVNEEESATSTIDELFPADNEIGSWVEDPDKGGAGVEVARSNEEAEAVIDGAAVPFMEHGFIAFARENYASGDLKMELRVWQMDNAKVARELYSYLTSSRNVYSNETWDDLAIGDEGRIANTIGSWWVNARTGSYYVEAKSEPATDELRTDAVAFTSAVLDKL